MNKKVPDYILFSFIILFALLLGFLSWRFERWMNWKFSYGNKVEQRIEQIEHRIDRLEKR